MTYRDRRQLANLGLYQGLIDGPNRDGRHTVYLNRAIDMSIATHALQFYKDGLGPDAVTVPALAPRDRWLFRCDGIEMARDGGAPLHVHAGPGLRCMIEGTMTVEDDGTIEEHREGDWWYETNVQPITARSTGAAGNRFVRVMIAAPEFEGFRTTQFIDPAEQKKFLAKSGGRWVHYVEKVITP